MDERFHLLVIEDDPGVASGLQDALENEGYRVTWQKSGQEGLRFAQTGQPDLIILDVRLPDGSGFDVCREVRAAGLKQPILMLTARRDELDKVLGLEMGADDYMTKPFSIRELFARIRALLRRAYGDLAKDDPGETKIHVADLAIDLDAAEVRRGQAVISLTPTEYRLLVYMVRHAGQALSRRQILQAVWKDAYGVENEKTVNVTIRRLREKIEPLPEQPSLILTVPGIGYRLVKT